MKKMAKMMAFLLAVLLVISELPLMPVSAEENTPQTGAAMRFVQKDFDPGTGILTMSLKIRPSQPGVVDDSGASRVVSGRFLKEGYLAFQVDPVSMEPVMADNRVITSGAASIAFVTSDLNSTLASQQLKDLNNIYTGKGDQVNSEDNKGKPDFAQSMGLPINVFDGHNSGFFVSSARKSSNDMLDCYLHFSLATLNESFNFAAKADAEGFIDVLDLRFQCYSGYDEKGNPLPANSDGKLYNNSIRLPGEVSAGENEGGLVDETNPLSAQETQELIDQFYSKTADPTTLFSSGGAGFREEEVAQDEYGDWVIPTYHTYYYRDAPRDTIWRRNKNGTTVWKDPNPMEIVPGLQYNGMTKPYAVTSFMASVQTTVLNNQGQVIDTLTGEAAAAGTPADFKIPSGENDASWGTFRYAIPKESEMEALQTSARTDGIWKGLAYDEADPANQKQSDFGYEFYTQVSPASTTKPETDLTAGGLEGFLGSIQWRFALNENGGLGAATPLDNFKDSLETTGEVETVTMESTGRTYSVQQAYIRDASSNYNGFKVQTVSETPSDANPDPDTSVHVTPVGIMFDFSDKTRIRYYDENDVVTATTGSAPQLRITNEAAEAESFLWAETDKTVFQKGMLYIIASYVDSGGGENRSETEIEVKLYKDNARVPARTEIKMDDSVKVTPAEGQEPVPGFKVPYGEDVSTDQMRGTGIPLKAYVYDQYGTRVKDENGNDVSPKLTVKADTETENQMTELGKSNAFIVPAGQEPESFRLCYAGGKGVNDVVPGTYIIKAEYPGIAEENSGTKELLVLKDENKFSLLDSSLTLEGKTKELAESTEIDSDGNTVRVVELRVPESGDGSATATISITELANQWRDPEDTTQNRFWEYDVITGLRNNDNSLNMNVVRDKFGIAIEWCDENGEKNPIPGVTTTAITSGRFSYTYEAGAKGKAGAKDPSPLFVTLSVTYPQPENTRSGEPEYVTLVNKYKFIFVRDASRNESIKINYVNTDGQATTDAVNLTVPEKDAANNFVTFGVAFYDQYGADMPWSDVKALNPTLPDWSMKIVGGKTFPGVSIVSNTLSVSDEAKATEKNPYEFDVRVEYGAELADGTRAIKSNTIHVKITRVPPRPVRITKVTWKRSDGTIYGQTDSPQIWVPEKEDANEVTLIPTVTVLNQYGEEMAADEYKMTWKVDTTSSSQPSTNLISLNSSTGQLTVKGWAPEWKGIVLRVTLNSRDGSLPVSKRPTTLCPNISVVRYPERISTMWLAEDEFDYPTMDSPTRTVQLSVKANSQYGAGKELDIEQIVWTLKKVTYADGTSVDGAGIKKTTSGSSVEWTDSLLKAVKLYSGAVKPGILEFPYLSEKGAKPVSIEVEYNYGGQEDTTTTSTITVRPLEKSYAYKIELYSPKNENLSAVLKVPDKGKTATKEIGAYVRDQYNFLMVDDQGAQVPVTWEILEAPVQGISLSKTSATQTQVVLDNTAQNGGITVRASYAYTELDPDTNTEVQQIRKIDLPIGIGRDIGVASSVAITGIEDQPSGLGAFEILLPGLTEGTKTVSLSRRVEDQFGVRLTSQAVQWRVKAGTDPYKLVKSIGSGDGKLTIGCTEDWKNSCDGDTTITIEVAIDGVTDDSGHEIVDEQEIQITKAAPYGAYAVPKLETAVYSQRTGHEHDILIPSLEQVEENGGPYEATFSAKVYSQYRDEMPGEPARILPVEENGKLVPGLTIVADPTTSTAVLKIDSIVSLAKLEAYVWAVPEKNQTGKDATRSRTQLIFDKGVARISGITLGSTPGVGNDNTTGDDLVPWTQENPLAPLPDTPQNVEKYVLSALVADQYNAEFLGDGSAYPVWEFAEYYPDIWFDVEDDDGNPVTVKDHVDKDGNTLTYATGETKKVAEGKKIQICVGNKAMGQFETQKTIKINVWVSTKEGDSGYFATQEFVLTKEPPQAKYLYYENIDSTGCGPNIHRPALDAEGNSQKITETVSAFVYDQNGYVLQSAPVKISLSRSAVTEQGAEVVPVYVLNGTESEEGTDGEPSKYRVKKNGVTMAEFDPATGEISVFTECNLDYFVFRAESSSLPGTVKNITLNMEEDATRVVKAVELHDGDEINPVSKVSVEFKKGDTERISEHFYPIMYDQYGEVYGTAGFTPVWSLKVMDEEGNLLPYTELDENGNAVANQERFVRAVKGTASDVTLVVNPEKYQKKLTLYLECLIKEGDAEGIPTGIAPLIEVEIKQKKVHTAPSLGDNCQITYYGGEHGEIKGAFRENVMLGEYPKLDPDLVVDKGYGVSGWTTNTGEFVRDPKTVEITGDTEFTAQYINVEEQAFLYGYEDHTVLPGRPITRGEFTRMLMGTLAQMDPSIEYTNPFNDVENNRYYTDYISCAYLLGIVSGYSDGGFHPESPITRAEAASMIAKAMKLNQPADGSLFYDVSAGSWYANAVETLARADVVSGYPDGSYKPHTKLTRAEAVTLLVQGMNNPPTKRELERIREYGISPFIDLRKDHWAYSYILRAAGVA